MNRPLVLIIALLLTGCYNAKKATVQHGRAVATYPEIAADYCARTYPATEKIIKGDSVVLADTLWGEGTTRIDTVFVAGKPIEVTKTIILPGKVITNTILRTDTVYKENTAALELSRFNEREAVRGWKAEQETNKDLRKKRNMWMWIAFGLGGSWLLFIFMKLRGKK